MQQAEVQMFPMRMAEEQAWVQEVMAETIPKVCLNLMTHCIRMEMIPSSLGAHVQAWYVILTYSTGVLLIISDSYLLYRTPIYYIGVLLIILLIHRSGTSLKKRGTQLKWAFCPFWPLMCVCVCACLCPL